MYIICTTKEHPRRAAESGQLDQARRDAGHSVIVLIQNGLNIEKPVR
jgi:hypothetical protein